MSAKLDSTQALQQHRNATRSRSPKEAFLKAISHKISKEGFNSLKPQEIAGILRFCKISMEDIVMQAQSPETNTLESATLSLINQTVTKGNTTKIQADVLREANRLRAATHTRPAALPA